MFVNKFFGSAFRDPSKLAKQDTSELGLPPKFSKYRTPPDWQNRTTPNWQNTGTLRTGTL